MKYIILGLMVLLAGCTSQQQMTCSQYCPTLPHAQCFGNWNSSGNYPDCSCSYVCPTIPQVSNNTTSGPPSQPQQNMTPPQPPQNTSPPPQPPPMQNQSNPMSAPPPTNKSIGSILKDGLQRLRSDFYQSSSGTYTETDYSWQIVPQNSQPGQIEIPSYNDVKFNGMGVPSIEASDLVVFNNSQITWSYGISVFQAKSTPLDNYSSFSIDYAPQVIPVKVDGCTVSSTAFDGDPQGNWLVSYYYSCSQTSNK